MSLSDVLPGGTDQPPGRRSSVRLRERRRRKRRRRALLALLIALLVLGGGGLGAWFGLAPAVRAALAPNDYPGPGTGTVQVVIPAGASGSTIARILADAGVVKTPKAFLTALKQNPRAAAIQPGTYTLSKQMSAAAALGSLLNPASKVLLKVTIPEGQRLSQIIDLLAKQVHLNKAQLQAAIKKPAALGLPPAAKGNVEGYLFPATYEFPPGVSPAKALSTMIAECLRQMQTAGVTSAQVQTVLIKASIVQAEAGRAADMPKVARVLDNRLAQKLPLQLDSTVSYATGHFAITTSAKDRSSTSRYNTYRFAGLPPGPIDSPGIEAIKAVLSPAQGDWLYFVTVNPDTGLTKFATTEAQRMQITREFQAWLRAHPQN
jgi:UPF0755 protein